MTIQYDVAKTEIASRLHRAEQMRSVKHVRRPQQRPGLVSRWQRHRSP